MRYLSVCSGIEAATMAWEPLGWQAVACAEIEKFPAAVLAYRWPHVPNLGDMTKIDGAKYLGLIDLLVGGTPCQSFSIAGLRLGLTDERGNLALHFVRIANESKPGFVVWENVPGVLSVQGNAFGCIISALAGCDFVAEPGPLPAMGKNSRFWKWRGKLGCHVPKWPDVGWITGPERTVAWRCLDAQYFGLAQRRKRLFLIACPRNGADPRKILFESDGLRRDFAPGRKTGESVAGTLESSFARSRGAGTSPGAIVETAPAAYELGPAGNRSVSTAPTLDTRCKDGPIRNQVGLAVMAFGGGNTSGSIDVATTLNAHGGASGRMDFESETFVANTLKGEGFDASEDGTGRVNLVVTPPLTGNPYGDHKGREGLLVPVAFTQNTRDEVRLIGGEGDISGCIGSNEGMKQRTYVACHDSQHTNNSGRLVATPINMQVALRHNALGERTGLGIGKEGDPAYTLQGAHSHAVHVAFNGSQDHAAFQESQTGCRESQVAGTLRANGPGHDPVGTRVRQGSRVRRLTPIETAILQGFPPRHTRIPWRGKPAENCPDGPQYKTHGNSMPVNVMRWLGRRIEKYDGDDHCHQG